MIVLPRLLDGRRQLTFARSGLHSARQAVLEQNQGEARDALERAARRLASAGRHSRSFPLGLLNPVPLLGSPARALATRREQGPELWLPERP